MLNWHDIANLNSQIGPDQCKCHGMGLFINDVIIFGGIMTPPPTGHHLSLFCYSRWSWSGSLYFCIQFRSKSGETLYLSSNSKVAATGPSSHFHTRCKYRAAWTTKKEHLQENISDVSSNILAIFWCKYVTKRKNSATLEANNKVRRCSAIAMQCCTFRYLDCRPPWSSSWPSVRIAKEVKLGKFEYNQSCRI